MGNLKCFLHSLEKMLACCLIQQHEEDDYSKNYTEAKATSVALTRQRHCQRNGNYRLAAKSLHLYSFVSTFVLFCQDRRETKGKKSERFWTRLFRVGESPLREVDGERSQIVCLRNHNHRKSFRAGSLIATGWGWFPLGKAGFSVN